MYCMACSAVIKSDKRDKGTKCKCVLKEKTLQHMIFVHARSFCTYKILRPCVCKRWKRLLSALTSGTLRAKGEAEGG